MGHQVDPEVLLPFRIELTPLRTVPNLEVVDEFFQSPGVILDLGALARAEAFRYGFVVSIDPDRAVGRALSGRNLGAVLVNVAVFFVLHEADQR